MRLISIKERKALFEYKCSLCGESIKGDSQYVNAKYPYKTTLKHIKCHPNCFDVANKIKILDRDSISVYTFQKKVKEYIYNIHIRGGKRTSKRIIDQYSIQNLVGLIKRYYDELEKEMNPDIPRDIIKEYISFCIAMISLPSFIDDLICAMNEDKSYSRFDKNVLKKASRDIESMANSLWRVISNDEDTNSKICEACVKLCENVDLQVSKNGVYSAANIVFSVIDEINIKLDMIGTILKTSDIKKGLDSLKAMMSKSIKVDECSFIKFIVSNECSSKEIGLTD